MSDAEEKIASSTLVRDNLDEIWNRKQIGRIYNVYLHNAQVHVPGEDLYGREDIISYVMRREAAFPDLHFSVEDIITGKMERGWLKVAVRWEMSGHNTGQSIYGLTTGRAATWHGINHYLVRDGLIIEEWGVDNELSVVRQLGIEKEALTAGFANRLPGQSWPGCSGEIERLFGQAAPERFPPTASWSFDSDEFIRRSVQKIWNQRLVGEIDSVYSQECAFHGPSDRKFEGKAEFETYVLSTLSAFSDLMIYVDDLWSVGDGQEGYRTTMRWTMLGTHDGPGIFGKPTGKRVCVTGISNHRVDGGKFIEEWTEFGEFAMLKNLYTSLEMKTSSGDEAQSDNDGTSSVEGTTVA
jgi:predicted ester cyclase